MEVVQEEVVVHKKEAAQEVVAVRKEESVQEKQTVLKEEVMVVKAKVEVLREVEEVVHKDKALRVVLNRWEMKVKWEVACLKVSSRWVKEEYPRVKDTVVNLGCLMKSNRWDKIEARTLTGSIRWSLSRTGAWTRMGSNRWSLSRTEA